MNGGLTMSSDDVIEESRSFNVSSMYYNYIYVNFLETVTWHFNLHIG